MHRYIGIPFVEHGRSFHGSDCWGVVFLYYKHEKGIELPLLSGYSDTKDADAISAIIEGEKPDWIRTDEPMVGDVIVFRIGGKPTHVGIYAGRGRFIHGYKGTDSCMQSLKSPQWANRIEGFYRYG